MKEVEIKAWIYEENKKQIKNYLKKSAKFLGEKIKNDIMYCTKNIEKNDNLYSYKKEISFRLREEVSEEKKLFLVTKKTRKYGKNGEEINNELEFEVTDFHQFHEFVIGLGYEIFYKKQKKIQQYLIGTVLVEWVTIDELGEFLEVECIAKDNEIDEALSLIMQIIHDTNLQKNIEKKPYGMLLGEF